MNAYSQYQAMSVRPVSETLERAMTWLTDIRHLAIHHDHDLAIFMIAGLLCVATSSLICSARDKLRRTQKLTMEGIWALCATAFLTQGHLPRLGPFGNGIELVSHLLAALVMFWLVRKLFARIRDIPAANLAKRTILWKLVHVYKGTYESAVRKLHAEYGAVVQVGPHEWSISDPAYFERLSRLQKVRALRDRRALLPADADLCTGFTHSARQ